MWDHSALAGMKEAGLLGRAPMFPERSRKDPEVGRCNVQTGGGGCGAGGACVCVWERGRDRNTRGCCTFLFFNFFEILSSADTMSVLCYNKGCGQRFDPENNPDGE